MEISRIFFSESILYIWEYKDSLNLGITSAMNPSLKTTTKTQFHPRVDSATQH